MGIKINQNLNKITEQAELPVILDLNKKNHLRMLKKLVAQKKIQKTVDDYREQLFELFCINNPSLIFSSELQKKFELYLTKLTNTNGDLRLHGKWIYYPWLYAIVHLLSEKDFQKVRTARNRELISEKEQEQFYNSTIGIGGLSVGNNIILSIVLQGGGKNIKLADFDRFALSNMNRVRVGIENLGLSKVDITARQIFQINPYTIIEKFPQGLNEKNINKFFRGLDIVIDELDNIEIKLLVRENAKKYKLPVVMGADDGDNAVVDIERYDKSPNPKFFHGRMGKITKKKLTHLDKMGIGRMITKHIGPENIPVRLQQSLMSIGKTIVSWPQLGGAAMLNGVAVSYCVRKILNKQPLKSNRAIISLDEELLPKKSWNREQNIQKKHLPKLKRFLGL